MDALYQNGWKIIGINIHVENIMQVENLEKYYIICQNIF
jgi:hypothetical protein